MKENDNYQKAMNLLSSLSESDRQKVQAVMKDKKALGTLLKGQEAKELYKKIMKGEI